MHTPLVKMAEYFYIYENCHIPYAIWSNVHANKPKTIVFLGTVQIGNLPKWVIENCPPDTLVVQGAPHWFAKKDGSDIPEYMFGFAKCVFDTIATSYALHDIHIIAESQGAPGVIELLSQAAYRRYVGRLTLVQPLGLNNAAYAGTDEQRLRTFSRRIAGNVLHQLGGLLTDRRLRYNHHLTLKTVNLRSEKARAQYSSGLRYDAAPNLKTFYSANKNIVVICGANDKIFPSAEIKNTLLGHGMDIEVRTVAGVPHSPLATKYGQRMLKEALHI